jgi:hypothetical protein
MAKYSHVQSFDKFIFERKAQKISRAIRKSSKAQRVAEITGIAERLDVRLDELPIQISVEVTQEEKTATATYSMEEVRDLEMGWKKVSSEGELEMPEEISRGDIRYAIDMTEFFKKLYPGAQVKCSTDETIDYDPT